MLLLCLFLKYEKHKLENTLSQSSVKTAITPSLFLFSSEVSVSQTAGFTPSAGTRREAWDHPKQSGFHLFLGASLFPNTSSTQPMLGATSFMLCVSSTFLGLHRTCGCLQWFKSKLQTALLQASQLSLVDNKQMSKWRCKCATAFFFALRDFSLCHKRQMKGGCRMLSKLVGCLFLASEFICSQWSQDEIHQPYSCSAQRCTRSWHCNCWAQQDMVEHRQAAALQIWLNFLKVHTGDISQAKATAVTKFSFPFPTRVVQEHFFQDLKWFIFF